MKILNFKLKIIDKRGMYLPVILMATVLFLSFAVAIISLAYSNIKIANLGERKVGALAIAEAGINYYMWHLAHDNDDYCDGGSCSGSAPYGPFTHDYFSIGGKALGAYELFITPPTPGNSYVTVKSIGKVAGTNMEKSISAVIGMPSFTKYTLLTNNSELWVGSGEKVGGSVFINHSGVRNDGEITGDTYSTETTYHSDMFNTELDGINGAGIFGGGKIFPTPAIDFNQLGIDILNLRNESQLVANGYFNDSGGQGWHIILNTNNYEIRKVKKYNNTDLNIIQEETGTTHDYPSSGVIYCEDDVWIEGRVNNQKITVAAADPEASANHRKRIIIPNSILFTNYDGSDKVGLLTQTDILLTRNSPYNIEIDAAMVAKDGEIKIKQYCSPLSTCSSDRKGNIKVYGSMAHNTGLIWTYDYGGGKWSGYHTTETVLDPYNVLNPPPRFPTTGAYSIISWKAE